MLLVIRLIKFITISKNYYLVLELSLIYIKDLDIKKLINLLKKSKYRFTFNILFLHN